MNTTAEEHIADAEVMPAAAPEGEKDQNPVEPNSAKEKVMEFKLTKEVATQAPAKTPQEYKEDFAYLLRVLTNETGAEEKNMALEKFNSVISQFKGYLIGKTPDEKAQIVSSTMETINPVMVRADALQCICMLMTGELANELKKDTPYGNWLETSQAAFPNSDPRELQKAMKLAAVRKAVLYCHVGKTRLNRLAAIASKAPFSSADDPIGMVLSQVQGHLDILPEEYEVLSRTAIADNNLKKQGVFIDQHVLREFYEYGEEITNPDTAEMLAWKERYEKGESNLTPTDFLRSVLKNDGKRDFELTNPKGNKVKGKGKAKTPAIPDINSTFEKTRETVQLVLEKLDLSKLKVDRELYHTLMTTLKTFGETAFPS
ncbi:hypothetical protein GTA51_18565 [Desulfovibrio aerotolerans]|uniref:Uncharacterized protein n=1 Tax=Solidesulfovibrio aerotolerans TaxID=295255 RepID=A0A7C9MR22_9BACT|nr:hypothetical protein [Solidesulfovibrio aerotolerans]MYL85112.1 hypothetical protein [Solidesulfovibrio aerotolerans]